MNDPKHDLQVYQLARDASAIRQEALEPMVRDHMLEALRSREATVWAQFREWLADDSMAFFDELWGSSSAIAQMMNDEPAAETAGEVMTRWALRWVNWQIEDSGYEVCARHFGISLEE